MIRPIVIVPLTAPGAGSAWLGDLPDARARRGLQRAMAADVVAVVRTLRPVPELALVADDLLAARRLAGRRGVVVEAAFGAGLNLQLACAVAVLGAHRPGGLVLLLSADIPAVQPRDILLLLRAAQGHDVVVVPDRRGSGTTGLAFRLERPPSFGFGADSCARHVDNAQRAGLSTLVLELPSFALDIDTVEDLRLLPADAAPRTRAHLAATGIDERAAGSGGVGA